MYELSGVDKKNKSGGDQQERIEALSQKLFGKPVKEIKYLYVTNYIHKQLLDEDLTRTGLYQWINVFNGEVKYPRDVINYNDYDIVHINMAPQDVHLIYKVRQEIGDNSKTKLVVNNDFTSEMWASSYDFPHTLEAILKYPDMIFGTEYFQVSALSELAHRKVYIIPHPADVRRLKALTPLPKKPIISTIWRRYDRFAYVPSLVVRNHGLTTQLIGYDKEKDNRFFMTSTLYDYVLAGTNFFEFCDQLRESKIVYDPFTFHSYSRTTVDTAAMGVAVVGSDRTQSMKICYPYTCVDPYDVSRARQLIRRLLEDEDFYELVVKTAKEKVEFYNHQNSRERFLVALHDSIYGKEEKKEDIKKKTTISRGRGDDVLDLHANSITRGKSKNEQ